MKTLCHPTINGCIVFIRVVVFFILVILVINCFIRSECSVKDIGLQIAVYCVLPAAISIVINPIRSYLATLFPISCGHRKCIFTGVSSKSLKEILLNIDQDIPSDEELRRIINQASLFLEDVKNELENEISTATFECIFSGSVAERYGVPVCYKRSDIYRALNTNFNVMFCAEADNASFSGQKGNVLVELIPDGNGYTDFAQLKPLNPRFEGDVVSSRYVRRYASAATSRTKITHFPQLPNAWYNRCDVRPKVKIFNKDSVINISVANIYQVEVILCIKCCEWPPTSDWPTRQRCWPSQEHVTRIVSHGCHLVAKPAPSDEELTSWRFSFSVAEVELAKLVPNTARKCFLALKVILKDHLQPVANISSYHLKTIFLNTLEKTAMELWVDENIEECFLLLIKELHDALVSRQCIHYWFRTINLFGSFFHPERISILIKKLEKVAENPAPFIFDDGCCCLYPCCTRLHLYDFPNPDGRQRNIDKQDEVIRVEPGMKNVLERNVAVPNHSLSQNTEGAVGEQSVRVTIHEGCEGDEINNGYDNDGVGDGKDGDCNEERRPMLSHFSNLPKYGAISNSSS